MLMVLQGTYTFMSHELLQNLAVEHDVHHDNDSFFYVIFFMAVIFTGPNDKQRKDNFPKWLKHWLSPPDKEFLGDLKSAMIDMKQ